MDLSRRRFLVGLSALAVMPLVGCGSGSSGGDAGSADAEPVPVEEGAFPARIEHRYGGTELSGAPARVVCVGLVEQDALLALGIAPVATTAWFGDAPGAIFPWATEALGETDLPTVLEDTDGLQFEQIAALEPDLILGLYSGMSERDYELLSAIAPTIAPPSEYVDWGIPWQQTTRTVGRAVGQPQRAEELVAQTEQRIADDAAAHPEFVGATGAIATIYEGIFVYGPEDPRTRLLEELGMTFPDALATDLPEEFGGSISAENVDRLDQDVVVWLSSEKQVDEGTGGLFATSSTGKEGRGVFISDSDGALYVAHSFVTVLSLPYLLDRYVPLLAAAVDGDPSTRPA